MCQFSRMLISIIKNHYSCWYFYHSSGLEDVMFIFFLVISVNREIVPRKLRFSWFWTICDICLGSRTMWCGISWPPIRMARHKACQARRWQKDWSISMRLKLRCSDFTSLSSVNMLISISLRTTHVAAKSSVCWGFLSFPFWVFLNRSWILRWKHWCRTGYVYIKLTNSSCLLKWHKSKQNQLELSDLFHNEQLRDDYSSIAEHLIAIGINWSRGHAA